VLVDSEVVSCRAHATVPVRDHGGSHCRDGYAATLEAAGACQTFDDMRQLARLMTRNRGLVAGFSFL
jgi:hypothetical protein